MEFIDLGLKSGTLWADRDSGEVSAGMLPKALVPTKAQFVELMEACNRKRVRGGLKLTGPNGNSIVLSLNGYGVPVYDLEASSSDISEGDKRKERVLDRKSAGRGFFRTADWDDRHNVIVVVDGNGYEVRASENPYRFSLRNCKAA